MKNLLKGVLAVAAVGAGVLVALHKHSHQPIDSSALLQALTAAHQPASALASVKQAGLAGDACNYTEVATRALLDADLHALALSALDRAPKGCPRAALLVGEHAEAFAREGKPEQAEPLALDALKDQPRNPYAELALSRLAYDKNQMTSCSDYAKKALGFGRGAEAERLMGRSALARGSLDEAEAHFEAVSKSNPDDAEAAFSAAVCNDKLGHYFKAREGFLQTLHIDPKHRMARIYLVMLTHNAGANEEAKHHLAKLAEIEPANSPELAQLTKVLDGGADGGAPDAGSLKSSVIEGQR